ncbi:hypothetical protein [Catenuloplanes indicus]|uniref:Uncharacterized protein n=1 Tax=Catenuloplanes indicus TaxID=137267 RepID=A0AAE3VU60_9ACTN|nr:hypothetical protein [Catenuloplanes indicus]MDQ0363732.1 hypothetical protein [Catenuloplanes indicus]
MDPAVVVDTISSWTTGFITLMGSLPVAVWICPALLFAGGMLDRLVSRG